MSAFGIGKYELFLPSPSPFPFPLLLLPLITAATPPPPPPPPPSPPLMLVKLENGPNLMQASQLTCYHRRCFCPDLRDLIRLPLKWSHGERLGALDARRPSPHDQAGGVGATHGMSVLINATPFTFHKSGRLFRRLFCVCVCVFLKAAHAHMLLLPQPKCWTAQNTNQLGQLNRWLLPLV